MTVPLSPVPLPPRQLPDADLWEYYRARGLSPEAATLHVERRRLGRRGQQRSQAEGPFGRGPIDQSTTGQALLRNTAQGALSGFGDELGGAMMAVSGPPARNLKERLLGTYFTRPAAERGPIFNAAEYTATRDALRQDVGASRVAHPVVSGAGTVAGALLNPLNKLLGPATAGFGPTATGIISGTALGGVQGLGEGTGTVGERLPTAAGGAVAGGLTGAALGKLTSKLWPPLQKLARTIRTRLGKTTPAPDVQQITEAVVRRQLTEQGQSPEVIEQLLHRLRQGGFVAPMPPPPPPPPTVRPGETIQPQAPKADPLQVATFLRRKTGRGMSTQAGGTRLPEGRGTTFPYYTRGGAAEQAVAPFPTASPPRPTNLAQGQMDILAQFLQGATPADLPGRLATMQGMGIPLPQNAEAQLLQILLGGTR